MSAQNLLRVSLFSALSFAATSLLPAQTVTLRGELHDSLIGGCYYCPTSHWVIKNSETPVTSSVVNLALFVNKQLALTGTWNATSKPPALNTGASRLSPALCPSSRRAPCCRR